MVKEDEKLVPHFYLHGLLHITEQQSESYYAHPYIALN